MQPFNFESAADTAKAVQAQGAPHAKFLAGGTTLVDLMKLHVETPERLIDITGLPLNKITDSKNMIEVGALVTNNEMAHHDLVAKNFPLVSQAILSGASVQLRNLATTSGNLLQRTRCAYFRDTACACNKREPGTGCSAIGGNNRGHAVLGGSKYCIATHASDMCVALMAVDAIVVVQSDQGLHDIPLREFYRLPGETPHIENVLQPGDLITSVKLPKQSWYKNSTYLKIRDRASYAFALSSAAVALDLGSGRKVKQARVALGGVGTVPWRAVEAEKILAGAKLTTEKIQEAANAALAAAAPQEQNAFKIPMAKETLVRTLKQVGGLS